MTKHAENPAPTFHILLATQDQASREAIVASVKQFVGDHSEFVYANDGSDAVFKLSNAKFHIAFLAKDLAKRNGLQIAEWLATREKAEDVAVILLCAAPLEDQFADAIAVGRMQFVGDIASGLEKAVARAFNFLSQRAPAQFRIKFLTTGETLMRQGEVAENVYLVRKGRLKATMDIGGQKQILGHIDVGEFVGELAYISGDTRLASVEAESPCELIEISIAHLDQVLFQKPAWAKAMIKTLCKRLKAQLPAPKAKAG